MSLNNLGVDCLPAGGRIAGHLHVRGSEEVLQRDEETWLEATAEAHTETAGKETSCGCNITTYMNIYIYVYENILRIYLIGGAIVYLLPIYYHESQIEI